MAPAPWSDMRMNTIPQPGKDWSLAKCRRPTVLSNSVDKLGEKCVINRLQTLTQLLHQLQYGSRNGRSGIDVGVITSSRIRRELREGPRVTLLGKDIVSAFKHETWTRTRGNQSHGTERPSTHYGNLPKTPHLPD